MLFSLMFCLWTLIVVAGSSRVLVGSGGSDAVIWGVVFVKGIPFRMKVIRPPPPPRRLSYLSVV